MIDSILEYMNNKYKVLYTNIIIYHDKEIIINFELELKEEPEEENRPLTIKGTILNPTKVLKIKTENDTYILDITYEVFWKWT